MFAEVAFWMNSVEAVVTKEGFLRLAPSDLAARSRPLMTMLLEYVKLFHRGVITSKRLIEVIVAPHMRLAAHVNVLARSPANDGSWNAEMWRDLVEGLFRLGVTGFTGMLVIPDLEPGEPPYIEGKWEELIQALLDAKVPEVRFHRVLLRYFMVNVYS